MADQATKEQNGGPDPHLFVFILRRMLHRILQAIPIKSARPQNAVFLNRLSDLRFGLDDLLAVVRTACSAYTVCKVELSALRALYHSGKVKLPNVGTSLISAGLGCFSLRYCHVKHLLKRKYIILSTISIIIYFLLIFK